VVRLLIFVAAASCSWGGEYAILSTGFKIHAESHVVEGDRVKLSTDKGVIELPVTLVSSFEMEEYTAPPPSVPIAPAEAAQATPAAPRNTRDLVTEAAQHAGLPPAFVHSIVKAESAYQTNAVSPKGAIGLMQLMPTTAAALHANPYDVKQNVEAGVAYLRELLIKYQNDANQVAKAIAAYNAGPGAVDKYNGVPPYRETVNYVNQVVKQYIAAQGGQ
jgi:soluble lytic murein transglycosylase-like protein